MFFLHLMEHLDFRLDIDIQPQDCLKMFRIFTYKNKLLIKQNKVFHFESLLPDNEETQVRYGLPFGGGGDVQWFINTNNTLIDNELNGL